MNHLLTFFLLAAASVAHAQDGKATTTKKAFSRATQVSISIQAEPEIIWALLTNGADITRWNSTLVSFEGDIRVGNKVKLVSTVAPDRTFKIKVKEIVDQQQMTWVDGAAPFFRGVRTYTLSPQDNGTVLFTMHEKIGGLMFPMAAGSLPSFDESFEQYAADLKKEAERIQKTGN